MKVIHFTKTKKPFLKYKKGLNEESKLTSNLKLFLS